MIGVWQVSLAQSKTHASGTRATTEAKPIAIRSSQSGLASVVGRVATRAQSYTPAAELLSSHKCKCVIFISV